MAKKCPHCGKEVKYLTKHIKRNHPDKVGDQDQENQDQENQDTLRIKPPPGGGSAVNYHCVECGQDNIKKGTAECPACGAALDWETLE